MSAIAAKMAQFYRFPHAAGWKDRENKVSADPPELAHVLI
jgi:hypothetical protein